MSLIERKGKKGGMKDTEHLISKDTKSFLSFSHASLSEMRKKKETLIWTCVYNLQDIGRYYATFLWIKYGRVAEKENP